MGEADQDNEDNDFDNDANPTSIPGTPEADVPSRRKTV